MAEDQSPFNAVRFSRVTKKALEFYQKGASEEEKKIVANAIRKAAKAIKKQQRAGQENGKDKPEKKGRQQAGAEQLAAGLYKVLSESGTAKVTGNPSSGAQTEIQGAVDLNEAARKLLSLA
jgi:hypothetical protein